VLAEYKKALNRKNREYEAMKMEHDQQEQAYQEELHKVSELESRIRYATG